MKKLCDSDNPQIKKISQELTEPHQDDISKIKAIFMFVRDHIKYGLTKNGDMDAASDTLKSGIGQCNNKNNLFVALLRATGYKARIHFGEIRKEILRGLISNNIYNRLPATLSHSWIEVELNGDWKRIDTHILDKKLFLGAKRALKNTNWDMGYAVANISISDFVLHDKLNPGTPIIPKDHGTWDDPMLYYESDQYIKPGLLSKILYLPLAARVNAKLNKLRHESRS